jgi:anthranilate synthase component 1
VITELEFKSLAGQGFNRIPLIAEAFADLETPLSLYLKLAYASGWRQVQLSCWSRSWAASASGRYSFIGLPARTLLRATGFRTEGRHRRRGVRDARRQSASTSSRPTSSASRSRCGPACRVFCGGLAGYFGYDAGERFIEPKLAKTQKTGGIDTPDILLLQCEELAVIDKPLRGGCTSSSTRIRPPSRKPSTRPKRRLAELADKLKYSVTGAGGQARRGARRRARVREGRLHRRRCSRARSTSPPAT